MSIFLLKFKDRALDGPILEGHPAFDPHAHSTAYVVRAPDEESAREAAFSRSGDEFGEGDWWLDLKITSCTLVFADADYTDIILANNSRG